MSVSAVQPNLRPTRLSGTLSVVVGFAAVASLNAGEATAPLAVEAVGLVVLAAGLTLRLRGWRTTGSIVALGAVAIVLGSISLLWIDTRDHLVALQFVPGMVGVVVLALGVVPARKQGSRRLVKAGTALVFLSVIAAGVVQKPSLGTLLVGAVAVVLAWDLGENAIGLGAQLGRRADTARVELVHAFGAVFVGVVAVVGGRAVDGVGSPGLPLGVFALLVIGLVLLAGALHD